MDNVALLKESLGRSENMTQNMLGILNTFESRLSRLEETIIPIYQETGNLQRRHENIEKTLSALDHVIAFYHVAEEVEPVIRDGPGHGLTSYLECMEKLQTAVKYFTETNPGSPEMSQVTTLYEAGKDALEREFRSQLTRHSKPVPPVIILDVLAIEEESPGEEPQLIEQLPERTLTELSLIAHWLQNCGMETDYMQLYSTVRSSMVVKSLMGLKDHLKSGSRDSASLAVSSHSPALSNKLKTGKDTPQSRKTLNRMAFVRKASETIKKHMAHLEAAGFTLQHGSTLDVREEGGDIDIDFYIASASALLKLIQSEAAMMQAIIPEKHQRKIFDLLIQSGLDTLIKEGEYISAYIKRAIARNDHSAVISLFPVLKHLRSMKPEFERTLEGCQAPTRTKLVTLISTLDYTGAKVLEEFVDSIKNDPDKVSNMPKDGTVHELTSNTIIFLEQLVEFADTAGAMLLTQDPTSLQNIQNAERPKLKLAEFMTKVLSALGANLTNKSETYSDVTLRSIFMLNNYNYILKSLRRTRMLLLVHLRDPNVETYYIDHIRQQKRSYFQSWSRVLHFIQDPPATSANESMRMKEKEKQMIKDKFTGFNKEIEDLHRVQKAYAIPDGELRESMKQDNKDFIQPKYHAFLRRYINVPFTKNIEKYHKYSEKDVSRFISEFFESAA
ncbi:hypothetical protein NP493_228g06031 [Ridgeia piscesae]|uniref:Exocyst complex component 7 n=1 Tax=Ridgeia piscesae TaxID=27915 RepID=A0AAD9NZY0_RIDPI|nr:hypothetical protein NP493_228g06031 [Ridgeia piscesae]